MADITRLSRFVGGLPRDVDLTTNTLHVESLKVGTTSPAELTKSMTTLLATIDTTGLPANKMSPAAMQSTLESKLAAMRIGVLNFTPTTGNTSDTVTTQVLGGAAVDTPIGAGAGIGSANAKGIFVGTVSGSADIGKVLIRVHGTDNGFDDGTGDEIYGVLSEATGVYTLSYKTAAGAAYTILAPDTASKFDFYFIEVMDLYSFGVDRLLMPAIGGVVDATTASSVYSETTARADADSTLQNNINAEETARIGADDAEITARSEADSTLQNNIDAEETARINADSTLTSNLNSEITARTNADSTLTTNLNSEITARTNADSTLTSNLNSEITARTNADSTLTTNLNSEITARTNADSTLTTNLNSEITARTNADSTLTTNLNSETTARLSADSSLQAELDLTQGSMGSIIDGSGAWVGFSGTHYLDAELTVKTSLTALDTTLYGESTARAAADSTLTSSLNSEITARQNADSTIQGSIQSAVDVETTARQDADSTLQSTLQGNIDAEATARSDADSTLQSTLQGNIDSEVTARQDADSTLQSTLQGNIDAEATARQNADSTIQGSIQSAVDVETTARQDADSTLTSNLNSEITARTNADSTLTTNLNSEITARLNADSSLQSELDATQGSLGSAIDGDGAWVGFSGTTFLDAELTFTGAFEALDSQLASIASSAVDVSFVAATGGISAGDVVALSLATGGVVIKANATGIATCESVVGVALETKSAGLPVLVRTLGDATVTTDGTNFDLGKRVYAHTVAGQASKTAPSTVNNVVYLLGGATATNKVFVNTNLEYVVT